jgi:hypothetical protein
LFPTNRLYVTGLLVKHCLAPVRTHFELLTRTPGDLLRHIGSPFAPDGRSTHSQADAA